MHEILEAEFEIIRRVSSVILRLIRLVHGHDPPASHLGYFEVTGFVPLRGGSDAEDELAVADGHVGRGVAARVITDARLKVHIPVQIQQGRLSHVLKKHIP